VQSLYTVYRNGPTTMAVVGPLRVPGSEPAVVVGEVRLAGQAPGPAATAAGLEDAAAVAGAHDGLPVRWDREGGSGLAAIISAGGLLVRFAHG